MSNNMFAKQAEIFIEKIDMRTSRFVILTFKAALDMSCKDGLSLLQALSHSPIPSEERNLQVETTVLSVEITTVFKTNRTRSMYKLYMHDAKNRNF